jgi:hypothetical protein
MCNVVLGGKKCKSVFSKFRTECAGQLSRTRESFFSYVFLYSNCEVKSSNIDAIIQALALCACSTGIFVYSFEHLGDLLFHWFHLDCSITLQVNRTVILSLIYFRAEADAFLKTMQLSGAAP